MAVRTKKVDVLALAKSSPGNPFALKRPGGGGALEVPTPPQITNFVFEPVLGLQGDIAAGTPVALFSASPETIVFSLINDADGLLALDGVNDDGKTILAVAPDATLPAGDHEVTIRATVGVVSADFTRTIAVTEAAVPFVYDVTPSTNTFYGSDEAGTPIATFTADDERLTLVSGALTDDAGGVFEFDTEALALRRGVTAAPDGPYTYEVTFTFEGDDAEPPTVQAKTFTINAVSID